MSAILDLEKQCERDRRSSALQGLVTKVLKQPFKKQQSTYIKLYQKMVDKKGKYGDLFAELPTPSEINYLRLRLPGIVIK